MFCWTIHLKGTKRCWHAAVAVGQKVFSFGGVSDKDSDQIGVHIFNTVSLCWTTLPLVTPGRGERHLEVPSREWGHTAVLIEDTVYLWGGYPYCNVLYAFDVNTRRWFKPQVSGTVPEGRYDHSACVLGKVMYIYGGWTQKQPTNDIYKLDTTTMVWSLVNTRGRVRGSGPPASWCHSATIIGTKMFVFRGWGGSSGRHNNITIRVFDTETNCWPNTSTQLLSEGSEYHSAFAYNGELYVFGGWKYSQTQYVNDLWKFSPETFSWKKFETKGKGPEGRIGMCCCMVGDRLILFGGINLYVLDLSPSLKTLCKLAVIQYGLEQSEVPHNIRWELAAMSNKRR